MDKKAQGYFIALALGAVVIFLVVYGLGNVGYQFAREKFFGERGVLSKTPSEKTFVPYTGPELTEDERIVLNSANALRCALNSVAVGEYKPDLCPPALEKGAPGTSVPPTMLVWAVTGNAMASKKYDSVHVECDGVSPTRVKVPTLEAQALNTIVQEILNCKAKALDAKLPQETRCAYLNVLDWDKQSYDENRIVQYMTDNKVGFPGWGGAIDWLLSSGNAALQNHIEVETFNNKLEKHNQYDSMLCVDFRRGTVINYISINGCDIPVTESFSCAVKNFQLPQADIKTGNIVKDAVKFWIEGFGDPRWLVYYESFPPEAAEYWHKDWHDIMNVWTIGTITLSGVLNMAGGVGGKAAKVAKTAAKEGEKLAKEGAEALIKKGITEAEQAIIKRLGKNGVENTMKMIIMEESVQAINGVGEGIANKITKEVAEAIGTKTGTRAWKKAVEKGLDKKIGDIIEKDLTRIPQEFIDVRMAKAPLSEFLGPGGRALSDAELKVVKENLRKQFVQEYRDLVKKAIIEGGEIPEEILKKEIGTVAGAGLKDGVKGMVEKQLTKELTSNIIKKRAYEQFLDKLITKEGTINAELLINNGEAALKNLNAIAKISPTAAQRAWAGSREILDIFLSGTLGGFNTRNFPKVWKPGELFAFISAQSPIRLSGRGFVVGGTAVKTVVGLPAWAAQHQYPVMLLLAWFIAAQDAANEKTRPVGTNAIAINQPTLLGPTVPLGLNEAATEYFVHNHITSSTIPEWVYNKYGQRMYFVSPCKANLNVYKRKCTCYKNPQLHKFTYRTGTINVEPGTVMPLSDPVLEARFKKRVQDKLALGTIDKESWRPAWNSLDEKAKAAYGNSFDKYVVEQALDVEFTNYDDSFFKDVVSPVGGLVRGRAGVINFLAGTSTEYSGLAPSMVADWYTSNYDAAHAIKRCDQSGFVKEVANVGGALYYSYLAGGNLFGETISADAQKNLQTVLLKDEYFKADCLEIEPERLDGTYCYDFFPGTAWIRTAVTVGMLAVDAAIIGFTGGLATPLALLGTGIASATIDVLLETSEKWP